MARDSQTQRDVDEKTDSGIEPYHILSDLSRVSKLSNFHLHLLSRHMYIHFSKPSWILPSQVLSLINPMGKLPLATVWMMFPWSFGLWGQMKRCSTPGSLVRESIATPGLQYKLCKPKWQHGFVQLAMIRQSEVCEQWIQLLWLRCTTGIMFFGEWDSGMPVTANLTAPKFSSFPRSPQKIKPLRWSSGGGKTMPSGSMVWQLLKRFQCKAPV